MNNGLFTGLPAVFCGVRCPACHFFFLRSSFLQKQLSHNLLACWLKQKTQKPKKLKYRKFQKKIKTVAKSKKNENRKNQKKRTKNKRKKQKKTRKIIPIHRKFNFFKLFSKLFLNSHNFSFFVFSRQYQIFKMRNKYHCKLLLRCK